MGRTERLLKHSATATIDRRRQIVVVCLLITVAFAPGMALLESEAGSDQFADDIPESDALDQVNEQFEPAFGGDDPSTQLIQRDTNVLDRRGLLNMLETAERIENRDDLRVSEFNSPASDVAQELDPDADTIAAQRSAIEGSTEGEVRNAVIDAGEDPAFSTLLADDYNPESGTASASLAVFTHDFPEEPDLTTVQTDAQTIAERSPGDVTVFGSGIVDDEFESVIFDSLAIVVPAALVIILGLLAYAYRDPFDFLLGAIALVMTIIWTFGFTGYVGIAFSDVLISVPVLLLAIGIDFGIHTINRYREERITGSDPETAMETSLQQLSIAYSIIAGTTIIGFLANLTSGLDPLREFGIVAAIGIVFTLVIFVGFLPAAKLVVDEWRLDRGVPVFSDRPMGSEGSILGSVLPGLYRLSRPAPAIFVAFMLVLAGGAAVYGSGVDTTFEDEDFLPPSEEPMYVQYLPGPLEPQAYTVTGTINFLEETFESSEDDTVTIYIETRMADDTALRSLERAEVDPPSTFVEADGRARTDSVADPIDAYADEDPEFAALVDQSALDGGQPNRNTDRIYSELRDSDFEGFTDQYLTDDNRATRVVYEVRSDAADDEITADARAVAERYRGDAIATGQIIVFQAVADEIFDSAIVSLATAIGLSAVFLIVLFGVFLGRPSLGLVTLVPVTVAISVLTASMRFAEIPFNALTATILAITIGLGVDYTVHVTHRFYDVYEETGDVNHAVVTTLRGTGGALTGTMATTAFGTGVLVLAITPLLGQFGLLTAVSIILAYLASLIVLPPALVVWVSIIDRQPMLLAVGRIRERLP
ncbi:efflux RND transporter permease subunit [Halalkalirubrum salinum]|uniref:efflux RND transporter permease subunit n=1 Tax=Halalkalirubrum salinum TaxID=2563889 RepID=UPI0010FAE856|nr:MMPL family transporter [Halalkalirubrum salinum]